MTEKMYEKTLEEKLESIKEEIKDYVREKEITLSEYEAKLDELLEKNNLYSKGKTNLNNYRNEKLGRYFLLNGPLEIHLGLKNDYISLIGQDVESEKAKDDVRNYNNVYEKAKDYFLEKIDPTKITQKEFIDELGDYILKQPEINNCDEIKKNVLKSYIPLRIALNEELVFKDYNIDFFDDLDNDIKFYKPINE